MDFQSSISGLAYFTREAIFQNMAVLDTNFSKTAICTGTQTTKQLPLKKFRSKWLHHMKNWGGGECVFGPYPV